MYSKNMERGVSRQYELQGGEGFLICPGQINTYFAHRTLPWKYVWLEFDGLRAAEFLSHAGLSAARPIYRPQNQKQAERMGEIMLYIANHSDQSAIHLIGYLYLFLDALIQSSSSRREIRGDQLKDFYIQEAVTYMERNCSREITVEEIADACKLSRSYFSKLFKDSMGCPPQEFLIRIRLAKAAEMMKSTRAPIGEISVQCGYPNQLHFSRAFKKRYGVSPRQWRTQNAFHPKG